MQFRRPASAQPTPVRGFLSTIAGRRTVRQAMVVVGAFLVGYLFTILVLFPAPLFRREHAVPSLLEMGVSEARDKLQAQGFRAHVQDQTTDPTARKGMVIWQDPPPGVVASPNTQVELTISEGPPDLPVPDLAGFPRALAEKVLRAAGFQTGRADTLPASSEPGTVIQTRPPAGVGRPAGTPIELVISSGPAELSVPALIGMTVTQARTELESAGLLLGTTTRRTSPDRPEGMIIDQRPAAGTRAPRGARVDLIVTRKGT